MSSLDKALNNLIDLGNPGVRRERAEQIDQALRTVLALTDGDAAAIGLPGRGERLVLHTGSPAPSLTPAHPEGSEVVRVFAQDPHPIVLTDLTDDGRFASHDSCPGVEAGPALFASLRRRGPDPGYLAVYRRRGRAKFSATDVRAIALLAITLQHSLEALRLSKGLEKLAFTDDLTEVYNERFLKIALKRELKRAGRFGQELSLLLVEPVDFAAWTQRAGAATRETWIKELAAELVKQVRSFDFVARFGAGQFMVVLPQTGRAGADEVAGRIRSAVVGRAFFESQPGALKVGVGVSAFPQEGSEPSVLVAKAQRALGIQKPGRSRNSGFERAA